MLWSERGECAVLACSALKNSYRRLLLVNPDVKLVYLRGSFQLVASRLAGRHDHYMNPNLLPSQFETLEEPHNAIVIDVDKPVPQIVESIRTALAI